MDESRINDLEIVEVEEKRPESHVSTTISQDELETKVDALL
jgi:hypothetical protein